MRFKFLAPAALLLTLVSSVHADEPARMTPDQWRSDLRTLAAELPKTHVNAYHAISEAEWRRAVAELDRGIPLMTRNQIEVGLMRLVAMIGDGHTTLSPFYMPELRFHAVPIRLYAFSDGTFVRAADAAHRELIGARLVAIGNVGVEEAFRRVAPIVSHDNDEGLKLVVPMYFTVPEILDGLGIIAGDRKIPYRFEKDGRTVETELEPWTVLGSEAHRGHAPFSNPPGWVDARDGARNPTPVWLRDPSNLYWMDYDAPAHLLYVQYNAVANKTDESIAAFFGRVCEFAGAHPVDRIVLDLRQNSGGNNYFNRPIIRGLLRARLDQRGTLFVIIGRATFSAAQNLVNALTTYADPIFIGEPTGSLPNQFGDHDPVLLRESGLQVMVSTYFHEDAGKNDRRAWTAPQIPAELSFAEYRDNVDPAMDAARRYESISRSLEPLLSEADPAVLESAYRKFKSDPATAWIPTESEVNDLGYRMLAEHRLAQAVLVFRLNATSYPASANVYDSLAEACLAAGDRECAGANYRKALELNPKNDGARKALEGLGSAP